MVSPARRAVVELVVAGIAVLGCGLSWWNAQRVVAVAAVTEGEPVTTSVVYNPQLVLLALLLATAAGVLTVLGTARLRRAQHAPKAAEF